MSEKAIQILEWVNLIPIVFMTAALWSVTLAMYSHLPDAICIMANNGVSHAIMLKEALRMNSTTWIDFVIAMPWVPVVYYLPAMAPACYK